MVPSLNSLGERDLDLDDMALDLPFFLEEDRCSGEFLRFLLDAFIPSNLFPRRFTSVLLTVVI